MFVASGYHDAPFQTSVLLLGVRDIWEMRNHNSLFLTSSMIGKEKKNPLSFVPLSLCYIFSSSLLLFP